MGVEERQSSKFGNNARETAGARVDGIPWRLWRNLKGQKACRQRHMTIGTAACRCGRVSSLNKKTSNLKLITSFVSQQRRSWGTHHKRAGVHVAKQLTPSWLAKRHGGDDNRSSAAQPRRFVSRKNFGGLGTENVANRIPEYTRAFLILGRMTPSTHAAPAPGYRRGKGYSLCSCTSSTILCRYVVFLR